MSSCGLFAVLVLGASWLAAGVSAEDWTLREELTYPTGNLFLPEAWSAEQGLHLRIAQAGSPKVAQIALTRGGGAMDVSPASDYPPAVFFGRTFFPGGIPAEAEKTAGLILKVRQDIWAIYIDDALAFLCQAPFSAPFSVLQPAGEVPAEPAGEKWFQKAEATGFRFEDHFLIPEGSDNPLAAWEPQAGEWRLHTPADNAVERSNLAANAPQKPEAAYSPNFYSVLGSGTSAVIVAGYDFYDSYEAEAAVETVQGEAGLVFYFAGLTNYFAFTAQLEDDSGSARLCLWRRTPASARDILAAAAVTLNARQWVKLAVRTTQTRIVCLLDGMPVLDADLSLPPGGRFGLYVDAAEGTRFDDVAARSNRDRDLRRAEDLRRLALMENGSFFDDAENPPDGGPPVLNPRRSKDPQWLVVGCAADRGQAFSARFEPSGRSADVGLVAGYTEMREPHYRFTCARQEGREVLSLVSVQTNCSPVLEILDLPLPDPGRRLPAVDLMCDATQEGEMRCYRDGELVLVHHPASPLTGGCGLYVGPSTRTRITDVRYRFEREDLFRNQYEKNPIFVQDPFMRHWSSPEGQWIPMPDKTIWHKSDFLGRFLLRMPYVAKSEIHLGVEEGGTNGAFVVQARGDELALCEAVPATDASARLEVALPADAAVAADGAGVRTLAAVPVDRLAAENNVRLFTLSHEGRWLWGTSGGQVLFKHEMAGPLAGRRIRVAGFSIDELKNSYVERYNVKDFLFTESLHEWVLNGGKWEMINRFQCQPRWSHMNGESATGPAALWTKYLFGGDLCVEMYAGIRQNWYQRCGDLNLTVLNRDTTPSQGYTVTCTGWDADHSERFTRLFKEGSVLAVSDNYLVPRLREGQVRRGYNPLVQAGRDVHGAWYYIKLRRLGNRIEYYFDNERVFSVEDGAPLDEGSMGIWTFMNSMMVARVTIAAERIRRRPVEVAALPPALAAVMPVALPPDRPAPSGVLNAGRPLAADGFDDWAVEDDVGRARLAWRRDASEGRYFAVENALGSGSLFARCRWPAAPFRELAGWSFEVKRTPRAAFNFHYSIGRRNEKGEYVPAVAGFHRLCGDGFGRDSYRVTGATEIPPSPRAGPGWDRGGEWTRVEAWLPADLPAALAQDTNLLARVEGFGNLQPSDTLQGLTGNGPGEGYAVRRFTEIRYTPPALSLATNAPPPRGFAVLTPGAKKPMAKLEGIARVQSWLERMAGPGVERAGLAVDRDGGAERADVVWVRLPDAPAVTCAWSADEPDTVELRCQAAYPDRRAVFARTLIGATDVTPVNDGFARRRLAAPRLDALAASQAAQFPVTVQACEPPLVFTLAWADNPRPAPPALMKITGLTPFFVSFEDRALAAPLQADPARMEIRGADPEQGSYLRVANGGASKRLTTGFNLGLSASRYPLLQFRYRSPDMANVSLALSSGPRIRLGEADPAAVAVRQAVDLQVDGRWHTWRGIPADAVRGEAFAPSLFDLGSMTLGSLHSVDQTGLYSELCLDDLAWGPAVRSKEQLAFTPLYFDFDGVAEVLAAVRGGPESYAELAPAAREALPWASFADRAEIVPPLDGVADGWAHVFVKARDRRGQESPVTDLPFLLDTAPLRAAGAFAAADDPRCNGTRLQVTFENDGAAPLRLNELKVRWGDAEVPLEALGSTSSHQPDKDAVGLNWAFLFRRQLDGTADGQTVNLVVAGIADGAGNASPDLVVPYTLQYAADKTPPTVLAVNYPETILCCTDWREPRAGKKRAQRPRAQFGGAQDHRVTWVNGANEEPYVCTETVKDQGNIWLELEDKNWTLGAYPCLSFRIRRPSLAPDEKTRMELTLDLGEKKTFVIPLTHPAEGENQVGLPQPIAWQSNVWYSITIDFRALLQDRLTDEERQKTKVKRLYFQRRDAPDKLPLHLQSVFVCAPWKAGDTVAVDAFDASGMGGVSAEYVTATNRLFVAPGIDPARSDGYGWIALKARDKPGNLTAPVHFPYHGTNVPLDCVVFDNE